MSGGGLDPGAAAGEFAAAMASADAFATAAAGSKALLAVPQSLRVWLAAAQGRAGQVER